ncbi:GAP family protein [Mycolicibacterium sp. XJ870]
MLSSVMALGLLVGLDPMRLGITLLVISRPRPVQNLLAYGAGCVTACIPTLAIPLTLLHATPMFKSTAQGWATSSTGGFIQIGMGVLALSTATLLTVRFWAARQRARVPTPDRNTTTLVMDSNTPTALSRLLGGETDAPTEHGSALRRLRGRLRNAWESGSLWVSFVIGLGFAGAPPDVALFLLAIIVVSGTAIGTQVAAVIAFIVGMLLVVEIILISYLVTPAKTEAIVQRLHDWAWAHHRKILIAMCTVAGVVLVVRGLGSV